MTEFASDMTIRANIKDRNHEPWFDEDALYWAQALAEQTDDVELSAHFTPIAKDLAEHEVEILADLDMSRGMGNQRYGCWRCSIWKNSKLYWLDS